MHTLMMITEYVGIVMLALELIYVMYQKKSYMQNLLQILVISCLINFIGYLFELNATNQETADSYLMAVGNRNRESCFKKE